MARHNVDIAAILGGQLAQVSDSDTDGQMRSISTDQIVNNELNFYPRPNAEDLTALVESIQANGLLEPPTVVASEGTPYYRLISGHSRMAAIRHLHSQHPADGRWAVVLCRVLPGMTKDQELTAVIEANRQRVKTPAILAAEAERLTETYIRRREAGEDLPGRIRDRVAEAMQVSKTKLANLSAIKNGIKVPGILRSWEQGDIPEAAALGIARLEMEAQYRLLDWVIDKGRSYTISEVRMFGTIWRMCKHDCPDHGGLCPNAELMYRTHYRHGEWQWCAGCCRMCLKRDTCAQSCCKPAAPAVDAAPAEIPKNPAVKDPRLVGICETMCSRVKTLREQTGLSKQEFAVSIGAYAATYSAWEHNSMPGSDRVPLLALCLGTTTDYLYGLTDDPSPSPAPPQWQPLDEQHWPKPGQLVAIAWDNPLGGAYYETARCVGGYHDVYPFADTDTGCELDEPSHEEYGSGYQWMPLPEKEDEI